jgi:hypothetical protein
MRKICGTSRFEIKVAEIINFEMEMKLKLNWT